MKVITLPAMKMTVAVKAMVAVKMVMKRLKKIQPTEIRIIPPINWMRINMPVLD